MKNIIIAIIVVLGIGGFLVYRYSSSKERVEPLAMNTTVIDVRTPAEYNASHAVGAELFPVEEMQSGKYPAVSKTARIALYCRSGRRAATALELMKKAGFTNVRNIGGLTDLEKYGLKTE